jgi:hypothetical protein
VVHIYISRERERERKRESERVNHWIDDRNQAPLGHPPGRKKECVSEGDEFDFMAITEKVFGTHVLLKMVQSKETIFYLSSSHSGS